MASIDPATGQPLPADAIQRVLFITARVHVYQIPPLASNKGYTAATWTNDPPIFTARLRILETSVPASSGDKVSTAILLEDGSSGELFAAAPYSHSTVVTQAVDSSRFFAVRVVGDGGRKATLGIGFEERSDAFDFGVTLQDANKALDGDKNSAARITSAAASAKRPPELEKPPDYSLRDGQTITVNIGGRGGGKGGSRSSSSSTPISQASSGQTEGTLPFLPPPPTAADVKSGLNKSAFPPDPPPPSQSGPSAKDLGFDDGEFGEFQ